MNSIAINDDNYSPIIDDIEVNQEYSQDLNKIFEDDEEEWRKDMRTTSDPFNTRVWTRVTQKEKKLGKPLTHEEVQREMNELMKEELEEKKKKAVGGDVN